SDERRHSGTAIAPSDGRAGAWAPTALCGALNKVPWREETQMKKSFRDFLADLEAAGEVLTIGKPVDPRDLSSLISQSDKAVLFEVVKEYPGWRVVGNLVSTRRRLALAMGSGEN